MRKSTFCFLILLVPIGLLAISAQSLVAQIKVGYVDTQKVMEEYQEAIDATQKLDELYTDWEREARNMQRDIQRKQERFSDRVLVWGDETKYDKQKEIQKLMTAFQEFQQETFGPEGVSAKKEDELMSPVRSNIQRAIREVAESEGYNYVFEITDGSDLLYASSDQPDLTDLVIRRLNREY